MLVCRHGRLCLQAATGRALNTEYSLNRSSAYSGVDPTPFIRAAQRVLNPEVGVHGPEKGAGSLFEEFGVTPGRGLNLDVPSAPEGSSYITYSFKNSSNEVVYVGRASGPGTPRQVLAGRLSKGHDHFTEGLTPEVVDVQGSKLASQGAEEVFVQGYREQGAKLSNIDEALSYKNSERIQRSLNKIEAYIEDLERRGLR